MCAKKAGTWMKSPAFAQRTRLPRPNGFRRRPTRHRRSSAALRDDGCPCGLPGLTSNNPPHIVDARRARGATAARRKEPGVCAVPGSNLPGLTMRMGRYSVSVTTHDSWSGMNARRSRSRYRPQLQGLCGPCSCRDSSDRQAAEDVTAPDDWVETTLHQASLA
jgi:hypothetical protein